MPTVPQDRRIQVSRGLSDKTHYLARVTIRANMTGKYAIDANSNRLAR
jgi:hypothetical protein